MVAFSMHNKYSNLYLSLFNFILGKKDKEIKERMEDDYEVVTEGVASFLSQS